VTALVVQNFRERQARAAEGAFASALLTFHAPLAVDLPAGTPRPPLVYKTPEEKYGKALSEFEAVEKRSPEDVADRARYYAALSRIELGDLAAAEKALSGLAARKDPGRLVPSLARLALADVYRSTGRLDKAVDAYRQMAEDASFALPRDHALMRLGALLEEARRPREARDSYRRLSEEFPASVYAAEARQRSEYLESAQG